MSSIVVQVRERKITVPLPNGDRTTAAEVLAELCSGALRSELSGKQLKLIFSGRVIEPRELVASVVPLGAVVQCAILGEQPASRAIAPQLPIQHELLPTRSGRTAEDGSEETSQAAIRLSRSSNQLHNFVWGFLSGFVVGPIMLFCVVLEPGPPMNRLGICVGCIFRTLIYEYREVKKLTDAPVEAFTVTTGENGAPIDINSFEVEYIPSQSLETKEDVLHQLTI